MAGISSIGRADLARVVGRGRRLVSSEDAAKALDIPRQEAARRLIRWCDEGWLRRVRRDLYVPVPVDADRPELWSEDAWYLADAVWRPCYFTGWTSANHWSLTEQVFRTTVVKTAQRVRASSQRLADADYLVAHAPIESFSWGMRYDWRHDRRMTVADPARTVVEILDDPRLAGGIRHAGEILSSYADEGDGALLIEYGDRMRHRSLFKRLGFLVEQLSLGHLDVVDACLARNSSGVILLDPGGPRGGARSSRWGLRVNVQVQQEHSS